MIEPVVPTAVEIVEIRIPIVEILEGQRINNEREVSNVFPLCMCMCCSILILYVTLIILKFIK